MTDTPQIPAGGGSFRRDRHGNLSAIDKPTQPAPSDKIPGSDPIFPDAPSAEEAPAAPVAPPPPTGKEA